MHFSPDPQWIEGALWYKKGGAGHVKDHVAVDNELWGDQSVVR